MSTYIMCTVCGHTVKGYYRKPHPGKSWCACLNIATGRTPEKPWANAAAHSYGKNFDFDTIKPNHKSYRAEDYRDAVVEAINILEETGMSPDKLNEMLKLKDKQIRMERINKREFLERFQSYLHKKRDNIRVDINDILEFLAEEKALKNEEISECEGYSSYPGATGGECMYCDKLEGEH